MCNNQPQSTEWESEWAEEGKAHNLYISVLCLHCRNKFAGVNESHATTGTPSLSQHTNSSTALALALHSYMQNCPCSFLAKPQIWTIQACSVILLLVPDNLTVIAAITSFAHFHSTLAMLWIHARPSTSKYSLKKHYFVLLNDSLRAWV